MCVCVSCAQFDQFLPGRSNFDSKRPENFVRIATFPSATFGPLFAFHCPLFFYEKQEIRRRQFPAIDMWFSRCCRVDR